MTCKHGGLNEVCPFCDLEYTKELLKLAQDVIEASHPFCNGKAIDLLRAAGFPVSEFGPPLSAKMQLYVLASGRKTEVKKNLPSNHLLHIKNCGCKCHTDRGPICGPCAAICETPP